MGSEHIEENVLNNAFHEGRRRDFSPQGMPTCGSVCVASIGTTKC